MTTGGQAPLTSLKYPGKSASFTVPGGSVSDGSR